jgi:transposase
MAQSTTIVGIDVAKDKVDAAIRSAGASQCFANTAQGKRDLLRWLAQHGVGKAVIEASGGYERVWARLLEEAGIVVRIIDPKRVRHFAKSAGRLAKNDPIDADTIAWFGEIFGDAPARMHDPEREALDRLVTARMALKDLQVKLANFGEHDQPAVVRKIHQAIAKTVAAQLLKLEAAIADSINTTERFAARAEIIESVPGLGGNSAAGTIALLPELGAISNKAAAALLGVAPFDDSSGKHQGRKFIRGGRQKLRNLLFMPIVGAATRHNPVLNAYYRRLIAKGKASKVALIACMRKLIVILNIMIARGEKWDATRHAPA